MPRAARQRRLPLPQRSIPALIAMLALIALGAVAIAASAPGASTKRVVAEAKNESLGRTVLTNLQGHTLYSLSVEKHGKFICTGSCLMDWHPLVVAAGVTPTGPVPLGTVKRPDDRRQVTYEGRPLYAFDGDKRKGEANGQGIKDVGTWHAATPPRSSQASGPPSAPEQPPAYPGGY
jgi:predicted lipoprotein with Yx(FWY)xxD motif